MRSNFFRDSTPCLSKGFPFCTVLRYPYLVTDPLAFGSVLNDIRLDLVNEWDPQRILSKRLKMDKILRFLCLCNPS